MRRTLLTTLALIALAAPAALGAGAPASVKLTKCSLPEHEAVFYARMQAIDGTDRMGMRFKLLERTGDEGFRKLEAPAELERWRWSKPGVQAFGFRQVVRNLPEHVTYRMQVQFRWYAADGEAFARLRRVSAPCRQFTALPNLSAQITRVAETRTAGVYRYAVEVTNSGEAAVTGVPLRLTVDGAVVDTKVLASLAPGESRKLALRGPACTGTARVEVDPARLIAETSEDDNAHELSCA